jgi:hypothetical protein
VTILRLSLPVPRRASCRRLALSLTSSALLSAALLAGASPAGAVVTTVGSTSVGLQPRNSETYAEANLPTTASFNNPEGNLVLHKNETYAIYWDPTDHYHGDWQHLIDNFFQGLGADSGSTGTVFAVDTQYTDRSDLPASYLSTFRGAYTDTDSYPTTKECTDPHPLEAADLIGPGHTEVCITDAQIRAELKAFIAAHGLQKGIGSIFYLLTPPAVTVCLDAGGPTGHCSDHTGSISETKTESYKNSFCSYHSDFSDATLKSTKTPEASTIIYGVIPWTAGGEGDYHLTGTDETSAYDCQDGGFYVNSKNGEVEKEKAKERKIESEKEKEEHPKNIEEIREANEAEAERELLEGPHEQEPNQTGRGPDGSYDTGLADLIVSQIGVQQQNIVTDPLLDAWKDSAGNETTDECRNFFAPTLGGSLAAKGNTFAGSLYNQSLSGANAYINDAFNLAAGRLPYPGVPCMDGISLAPEFTAPNPVNTGELVGFDGMESNITLNDTIGYNKTTGAEEPEYAIYKWNFGDGSPEVTGVAPGAPSLNSPETSPCELPWKSPCAASTFHSYQYGGTYNVTLTVTDVGGHTASVTHEVTVDGTARPSTPSAETEGVSKTSSSTSTTTSSSTPPPTVTVVPPIPAPIAAAAAVSRSLRSVVRKGLVVRYSVNEQVAGHFEVLLSSAIAHRLGIGGVLATGLPVGSPSETVIAKAILVTTKGGRNAVDIQFPKRTAARLARLRSVPLMLRLIVRNASSVSPTTTTVVSDITLSH